MLKRLSLLSTLFLLLLQAAQAGTLDTVDTYSAKMNKTIKAVVARPANYTSKSQWPVVYLLHGYSGSYRDWAKNVDLGALADKYELMIVCPDGAFGSWYWDSPIDPAFQYETYVGTELPKWIDEHYKTIKDKKGRAITGLSMGGHGALYLSFRHQDVFGAAGSMSGGVDIRPFPNNWDMAKRLGTYAEQPQRWEQNTVINLLHLLTPQSLALIIDCGTDDFFYRVNENLHAQLLLRNIPHDYYTRPGAHNWEYWKNALPYQLHFMKDFFHRK